jgi:flavin reductase (DIM6/NTAB) family NADH-FMN oxidoreductase RutF
MSEKTLVTLSDDDIALLPRRKRGRLVNSLSGFKSVNLIGTQGGPADQPNLAIVSSVVHLGSDPALLGMVMRPPVPRERGSHTYWNIRETGVWTVNHVHEAIVAQAHQTSARHEESEFAAVGLTPLPHCGFDAPAVEEAHVRIGLELADELPIERNGCKFLIGQIRWVEFPQEAWAEDGYLHLEALGGVAASGLDGYHTTHGIGRFAYAKPDQPDPERRTDFMAGWGE